MSERKIFLVDGKRCYIIKCYTHTAVVHLMKENRNMEVHQSYIKTWYPNRKPKVKKIPAVKVNPQTSLKF